MGEGKAAGELGSRKDRQPSSFTPCNLTSRNAYVCKDVHDTLVCNSGEKTTWIQFHLWGSAKETMVCPSSGNAVQVLLMGRTLYIKKKIQQYV